MISGSFDEYEVWEESDRVYIKDPNGNMIQIPKDYFEEFVSFMNGLLTGVIKTEEYDKMIGEIVAGSRGLSSWEATFIQGIAEKVEVRGNTSFLSPKQKAIVKRIHEEKC